MARQIMNHQILLNKIGEYNNVTYVEHSNIIVQCSLDSIMSHHMDLSIYLSVCLSFFLSIYLSYLILSYLILSYLSIYLPTPINMYCFLAWLHYTSICLYLCPLLRPHIRHHAATFRLDQGIWGRRSMGHRCSVYIYVYIYIYI